MEREVDRLNHLVNGTRDKAMVAIAELQSLVQRLSATRQLLNVV